MKKLITIVCMLMACALNSKAVNVVAEEGAWCWFADPRAMHYKNEAGTIDASYVGYIDVHGNIMATQYDYITGRKSDVLVRSAFQPDDHDNPTFLVLPDERIFIIYSRHTDEACFYYRISTRPGDITSLGNEHRLVTKNNTTYPSPFILSDDPDHIYLCWRGIGWHPTIAKLSMPDENDEVEFVYGPYQMVQSTGARPYAKYYSNGKDKLYFSYTTGHPDNEDPNWLYFNVVNINGTDGPQLEDIDGKKLKTISTGTFAVNKTDSYKNSYPKTVVDATSGRRDWVWQLTCDEQKRPVIAMVKITSDKATHDYYYAHWDGTEWKKTFLANGGGRFHTSNTEYCYSGGMAIDPDDHHEVYLSCPTNRAYEIWHYTMNDNNEVAAKEQVTSYGQPNDAAAMTGGNVRPFIMPGSTGKPIRLMWMNGYYQYWIVKQGYPLGYPTAIHADGEWLEDAAMPETKDEYAGQLTGEQHLTCSPADGDFTLMMNISLNDAKQENTLCHFPSSCPVSYGINGGYACLTIGDKTYKSSNKYYTSDNFATNSTGTASDWWDTPIASSWATVTYDGHRFTTYRDGLIDLVVECEDYAASCTPVASGELPSATVDNGRLNRLTTWQSCLTPMQIQRQIANASIDLIEADIPATVNTDIVLPARVGAKNIVWSSSNPGIVSETGIVNLPRQATEVTLTATVGEQTRDFIVTVMPRDIEQNMRASLDLIDMTKNTATGFETNTFGKLDEGLLKGLRSYTVLLKANAASLSGQPRLYDFGGGSGNSFFLRAKALSAGIKYNGGTTTMVNGTVELKTNQDYCLAVTFDAATKETKIYVDGEVVANGTANQNEPYMLYQAAGDARNYVGRTQWWDGAYAKDNQDFIGTISELAVYDIALKQKEICNKQGIAYQEKEYPTALTNDGFEAGYSEMQGSGVSSDRAIYAPEGWTIDYSVRNENDFSALKDGDKYYSQFFAAKPQPAEGGKQTLWVRQRWGESNIKMFQELRLPEGSYTLTASIFSSDTSDKSYVYVDKQQAHATAAGQWQTVTISFEADGEAVQQIGCSTSHASSDGERICAFDNFVLTQTGQVGVKLVREANGSVLHDLLGRRLSRPVKGINITAGKKVVVK